MEITPAVLALLPLLILLACPLVMWWVMRGKSGPKRTSWDGSSARGDEPDAEVHRLRTRIAGLESESPREGRR